MDHETVADAARTTTDAAIAAAGSKATAVGAGGTILGWMMSSEAGVLVGIIVAVVGLVINAIFKIREDHRRQEEHEVRMEAIRHGRLD